MVEVERVEGFGVGVVFLIPNRETNDNSQPNKIIKSDISNIQRVYLRYFQMNVIVIILPP